MGTPTRRDKDMKLTRYHSGNIYANYKADSAAWRSGLHHALIIVSPKDGPAEGACQCIRCSVILAQYETYGCEWETWPTTGEINNEYGTANGQLRGGGEQVMI
mgnify:CR=1 FL=1